MNEMEKRKPPEVNLAGEFSETEDAIPILLVPALVGC